MSSHPPLRVASVRDRRAVEASAAAPIPLRLCATRGALGLELTEPLTLGPLRVRALSTALRDLTFPLDLAGGVRAFRHRRGALVDLTLDVELDRLARWLGSRLREAGLALQREPELWPVDGGVGVGLVLAEERGALAFDALWAATGGMLRLVLAEARGAALEAPAMALALRCLQAVAEGVGTRQGRVLDLGPVAHRIARAVLPELGARAPDGRGLPVVRLEVAAGRAELSCDAAEPGVAPGPRALAALALAGLSAELDEALLTGRLDDARTALLEALERAPRHPELSRLLAALDAPHPGRAEATLGVVVESLPAQAGGFDVARLLRAAGDDVGAVHAVERAAREESFAPVAALTLVWLAEQSEDQGARRRWLDRAVARAPALATPRWARLGVCAALGDLEAARAEAESLEALARGAPARHGVLVRAADELVSAGFVRDAGRLYERALRHLPDEPRATLGLGRALLESGRDRRGVALLLRAVELADARGESLPRASLELARALAERLGDLPQAIARVREVPGAAAEGLEARALEARWRARLGDLIGASLAWARLREQAEHGDEAGSVPWLLEAAHFEEARRDDLAAAERHLAVALRKAPRDREVAEHYRRVAGRLADRDRPPPSAPPLEPDAPAARRSAAFSSASASPPPAPHTTPAPPRRTDPPARAEVPAPAGHTDAPAPPHSPTLLAAGERRAQPMDTAAPPAESPAELLRRAEDLEGALRSGPVSAPASLELAHLLERLERDRDAFAVLTARFEDADPSEQELLGPAIARLAARLEDEARRRGDEAEAELYARWAR